MWTGCPVTRVGRHEARHGLTQTTMLDTQPCIDNGPAAPPQERMFTELSHGRATLGQQMQQRARQLRKPVCRQAAEPAQGLRQESGTKTITYLKAQETQGSQSGQWQTMAERRKLDPDGGCVMMSCQSLSCVVEMRRFLALHFISPTRCFGVLLGREQQTSLLLLSRVRPPTGKCRAIIAGTIKQALSTCKLRTWRSHRR
jgi:hypothetical protein